MNEQHASQVNKVKGRRERIRQECPGRDGPNSDMMSLSMWPT